MTTIRNDLIKEVCSIAAPKLSTDNYALFVKFVEHTIHVHPDEDLMRWPQEDLFGLFFGLYNFALDKPLSKPKLKVFNPAIDTDTWTSNHTLIYFCQRDMPFLIDSLRMMLNNSNINIHLFQSNVVAIERDAKGQLTDIGIGDSEFIGYMLIDCNSDKKALKTLQKSMESSFNDVASVVDDYADMTQRLTDCITNVQQHRADAKESIAFLQWLRDGNFTFFGCSNFGLDTAKNDTIIFEEASARYGLLKKRAPLAACSINQLSTGFSAFYRGDGILSFTKSSQPSTVHRDAYCDYIIVKRFNDNGDVCGETRFMGLYSRHLYQQSIRNIPLVREKAQWLLTQSAFAEDSHNHRTFLSILQNYPRDELIKVSKEQLFDTSLGIWKIYDRRTTRVFVHIDSFEKYVSCMIFLPKDAVSRIIRRKMEQLLIDRFAASACETDTDFIEKSKLARFHCVLKITGREYAQVDMGSLEEELNELSRSWSERLAELCTSRFGEEHGSKVVQKYIDAFPAAYQERFSPQVAAFDIKQIESLYDESDISINLFREIGSVDDILQLKMLHPKSALARSDIIPLIENLGAKVVVEHPFKISATDHPDIWLHEFQLQHQSPHQRKLDISAIRDSFQDAFRAVWQQKAENDSFNKLVFAARLDWRAVGLLRAYARYLKQLGSPFSLDFISHVLQSHTDVTRDLMALFRCLFDPRRHQRSSDREQHIRDRILTHLDTVANLNEDQVLRQYLSMIDATLRTNFFQRDSHDQPREAIALKIATKRLDFAPEPKPEFEVYIYSPRVEGVHLRGGKVARGGIRWSDRLEDFRTEVLGLVKAQQVKNAVIVPTGAKGGFVARQGHTKTDRDSFIAEGVACYQLFISSLLDITDNRSGNDIIAPDNVVRRDDDDPYFVVAADKGTATFSDIANKIALERGFWLGDAFASGGSNGYDHKAMGITARGAWVAVQRHFRELGVNIQTEPFTVIGIGDMAGDVFGNGMLLSKHIKLVAAFNHQHIFIDPNPDPASAWQERQRLFELPRSSWSDYDTALISEGGGVFNRDAKAITLTPQIKQLLASSEQSLTPQNLINRLLKAEVDLIWNGGIGTYVKASSESHADAGDRANDGLRVNGADLRCRVFGEGGNLGLTQLGRMEFCQNGGICNTDFIDNAAGVDCSDHEVNIKILLNACVEAEDLTVKQRNQLLVKMTDQVAQRVLANNYRQTLAISLSQHYRVKQHHDYLRFVESMEAAGRLNRSLEFIPDDDTIKALHADNKSWSRPELSVLISYAKVQLKEELLASNIADNEWVARIALRAFPELLRESYEHNIFTHRLLPEIVSTQLANKIVNQMGFTYYMKQQASVGANAADTAKAFLVVMELFNLDELWHHIEQLDFTINSELQHDLFQHIMRIGRRSTRWFLRNRIDLDPNQAIVDMDKHFADIIPLLGDLLPSYWLTDFQQSVDLWVSNGLAPETAAQIASFDAGFLLPGIIQEAQKLHIEPLHMVQLSFKLADTLSIDWLMQRLVLWLPENRWQDLARESDVDDLEMLLRKLTTGLAQAMDKDVETTINAWQARMPDRIERFVRLVSNLKGSTINDLSVFTVAMRELKDLVSESLVGL